MVVRLANNAGTTLAANISAVATVLTIAAEDAPAFPELGNGDWFPLTIDAGGNNIEIVHVTGRVGATLTVLRGQEGTTARAFASGVRAGIRATIGTFNAIKKEATDLIAVEYGIRAYRPAGVTAGGYDADRRVNFRNKQRAIYAEIIDGDPGSSAVITLSVSGQHVYGPFTVTQGAPFSASNLNLTVEADADVMFIVVPTPGKVRELYVKTNGAVT